MEYRAGERVGQVRIGIILPRSNRYQLLQTKPKYCILPARHPGYGNTAASVDPGLHPEHHFAWPFGQANVVFNQVKGPF
jgi:hypothetical protein